MEGESYQHYLWQNPFFRFLRGGHDIHPGEMLFHHGLPESSLKRGRMHLSKDKCWQERNLHPWKSIQFLFTVKGNLADISCEAQKYLSHSQTFLSIRSHKAWLESAYFSSLTAKGARAEKSSKRCQRCTDMPEICWNVSYFLFFSVSGLNTNMFTTWKILYLKFFLWFLLQNCNSYFIWFYKSNDK